MIRDKSFLLKLKFESSDEFLFYRALKRFRSSRCHCPSCGAKGGHKRISFYSRMMITVVNGKRCEKVVQIPVYRCSSCEHSHALLPDVLIPFASYTLRFILTILRAYLNRQSTVCALCDHWQISVSTLYGWIHLFSAHYSAWRGILFQIEWINHQALNDVEDSESLPSAFFERFHFSFLQARQASRFDTVAITVGGT